MAALKAPFPYLVYPLILFLGGAMICTLLLQGFNSVLSVAATVFTAALSIHALERLMPFTDVWRRSRNDVTADGTHYAVNYTIKAVGEVVYAYPATRVLALLPIWPAELPFVGQLALAMLIFDFFFYVTHRMEHHFDILWRFHAIHHSSERLYWLNGEKRHPVNQLFNALPGVTVLALLGTPFDVVVASVTIFAINMILQHSNIDQRAGLLRYVFAEADLHRWHHRRDYREAQVNFGTVLIVWDRLFGTYCDSTRATLDVRDVGIDGEGPVPNTYWGQLWYPLKRRARPGLGRDAYVG